MDNILKGILELLRNSKCAHDSVKEKLSNLIETLNLALSGQLDTVQKAQVQSLSNFPTNINELTERIKSAIDDSMCSIKEKSELQKLLKRFLDLVTEYRIANSESE